MLGFLVSLALKASLDSLFKDSIPGATTLQQLLAAMVTQDLPQLTVFLLTLLRFFYGAYRFHESIPARADDRGAFWNIVGMFGLFVLFYLTGLAVKSTVPFYALLGLVHVWDFVWFTVSKLLRPMTGLLNEAVCKFIVIDLVTILCLVSLLVADLKGKLPNEWFTGLSALTMVILALIDIGINWKFFFPQDKS